MKRFVACIGVLLAVMLSAEAQTYVNPFRLSARTYGVA